MTRTTTVVLLSGCLAACSSLPGFDDPAISVMPRYHIYKVRGESRMQSAAPGGGLMNNAAMDVETFGLRRHGSDVGGVLAYGDGFSGVEFAYTQVDLHTTQRGVLTSDWGKLPQGTEVIPEFTLEEFRLGYLAQLFQLETEDEATLRLGVGAVLAHREGKISLQVPDTDIGQQARFKDDGVPYLAARARGDYRQFGLQADYAYNPDVGFGGDFDGMLHDFELLGSYTLEAQNLTFLAGYRWSYLPTSGSSGAFRYDNDLRLEGYVLGLELRF